jgi:hypothetical protein
VHANAALAVVLRAARTAVAKVSHIQPLSLTGALSGTKDCSYSWRCTVCGGQRLGVGVLRVFEMCCTWLACIIDATSMKAVTGAAHLNLQASICCSNELFSSFSCHSSQHSAAPSWMMALELQCSTSVGPSVQGCVGCNVWAEQWLGGFACNKCCAHGFAVHLALWRRQNIWQHLGACLGR